MSNCDFPTNSPLCVRCLWWNGDPTESVWPTSTGFCHIESDFVEAQATCPFWERSRKFTREEIEGEQ